MADEKEMAKFRQVSEGLSAHFREYLIIVRTGDSLMMKASDATWGVGAADRYANSIRDEHLLAEITKMEEAGE